MKSSQYILSRSWCLEGHSLPKRNHSLSRYWNSEQSFRILVPVKLTNPCQNRKRASNDGDDDNNDDECMLSALNNQFLIRKTTFNRQVSCFHPTPGTPNLRNRNSAPHVFQTWALRIICVSSSLNDNLSARLNWYELLLVLPATYISHDFLIRYDDASKTRVCVCVELRSLIMDVCSLKR